MEPMVKIHTIRHQLPISNNWGGHEGKPSVYCGRCKDIFPVDKAWADRYFASKRKALETGKVFDPAKGDFLSEDEARVALKYLEDEEIRLKSLLV